MKFLLSILVIIGNLNVLLASNDNCRENDLNALMVRLRVLRTEFGVFKIEQETELKKLRQEINDTSSELKELRQNTSSEIAAIKADLQKQLTTLSQKIDTLEHAQGQIQTETLKNLTNILKKTTDLQNLVATLSQKYDKLEHAQGQIQTKVLQNTYRLNEINVSVGFAVSKPDNSSGSPLKFKNVIYNSGDDYNLSSGEFTCRHPGLYFFTATLHRSPGIRESYCVLQVNGIFKFAVNSGADFNDGYQSGTAAGVYRLNAGDIVILTECDGQDHMYRFSSFTGFRVSN